jgi:uncharacterized protein YlzI (FlbEa/FlbD family)
MSGWIGVVLDATLAIYNGNCNGIGEPVPKMVQRVKEWISAGRTVKIFTARVSPIVGLVNLDGSPYVYDVEAIRTEIQDWCEKHIGVRLEVTNAKDFGMIELWDDRAIQVVPNTGETLADGFKYFMDMKK